MRLYPSLAEGTGLENRKASQGVRGFESLEPRHLEDRTSLLGVMFFYTLMYLLTTLAYLCDNDL